MNWLMQMRELESQKEARTGVFGLTFPRVVPHRSLSCSCPKLPCKAKFKFFGQEYWAKGDLERFNQWPIQKDSIDPAL